MGIILEINTQNATDFFHEGFGASLFVVAVHVVAPINFVDFAGSSTGGGSFEIAREGKHGDVAGVLICANNHDGIGKLGAVVYAVTFVAFHVVAAGTNGEDVGATVIISLETFVSGLYKGNEVENVALATGDFGDNVIAPDE